MDVVVETSIERTREVVKIKLVQLARLVIIKINLKRVENKIKKALTFERRIGPLQWPLDTTNQHDNIAYIKRCNFELLILRGVVCQR